MPNQKKKVFNYLYFAVVNWQSQWRFNGSGQIVGWRVPLKAGAPLWEILDPPLQAQIGICFIKHQIDTTDFIKREPMFPKCYNNSCGNSFIDVFSLELEMTLEKSFTAYFLNLATGKEVYNSS